MVVNPAKDKKLKDKAINTLKKYKDNNKLHQSSKIEKKISQLFDKFIWRRGCLLSAY